jgi:DNA polymerase III subunit delta
VTTAPSAADVDGDPGPRDEAVPVVLVRGTDSSLVAQAAHAQTEQLVGSGDPSLMVEEFGGPGVEPFDVGPVIDACTTPPFLVERRVVVLRDVGQLAPGDVKRIVEYLKDPLATTVLVLVAGGGTLPQALTKAVGVSGRVVDTSVGNGRARSQWLADHVREGPVRLDGAATALLSGHLGEDMGRLEGLLDTLASAYGRGATVSADDLEPFLGTAGNLAPWDLTDAIDAGKAARALSVLHRMLDAPESHPLRIMSVLHGHYRKMLQLDGSGVTSAEEAAQVLGMKSAFPAKKALGESRRLGSERIAQAIRLLALADLDIRGATGLPGATVLEVLVARLCRLAGSGR